MKSTAVRIVISASVFLVFSWVSSIYYMKFIHDVGGTYWAMGVFGLPFVLLAVWCIDFYLKRLNYFKSKYGLLTAVDSLFAVIFYYPGLMLTWGVVYVLDIA
jgi:hypothetical protein